MFSTDEFVTLVGCRRDVMVREIVQSYDVYEDLLAKTQKGVEFYNKLSANVTRLLERARSVCKAQGEERALAITRLAPKGRLTPCTPSKYLVCAILVCLVCCNVDVGQRLLHLSLL